MTESIETQLSAVGERGQPASESIERTIAVFAAVLPILKRLEANREGAEKEANAKHRN